MSDNLFNSEVPVIFSYSRKEAIEDGVLFDLSKNFPEECRLYKYHVACTSSVWGIIDKACGNIKEQAAGVVWDILYMSIYYIVKMYDASTAIFEVNIFEDGKNNLYKMKVVIGPGDNLEPVITIMLPNED